VAFLVPTLRVGTPPPTLCVPHGPQNGRGAIDSLNTSSHPHVADGVGDLHSETLS